MIQRTKRARLQRLATILLFLAMGAHAQKGTVGIRPYNEVVTPRATTQKGFLTAHELNGKLYLEIPDGMLGRDMLLVEHKPRPAYKQVRWKKKGDHIHLTVPEVESEVGNTIPLLKSDVQIGATGYRDILNVELVPAAFPILAINNNGPSYVVDATSLFLDTPRPLPGSGPTVHDGNAHIKGVRAFDHTIEVGTEKTHGSKHGPMTKTVGFSLSLLPEAMVPRLFDHRMGFFNEKNELDHGMARAAIMRWRLEKKDKHRALSEPVRPIVLYLDPAAPEKWKSYLRAGVEAWLPAFEAAGFKKAIVVREPSVHDKDFSVNSMRYSIIRWMDPTKYRGHEGGSTGSVSRVVDQRTGEILKGDILIGAPYELLSDQYFIRCAPLDKRARQYPFPDDLMGELIQRITSHETGHLFGLKDGNYGEYTYPLEKMRDKEWLEAMGHTPSIMTYARHNGLVQPEDNIPSSLLIPKVGPTDFHSIRWAYTPFPNCRTPDDELPHLEKIIRERDSVTWYGFSMPNGTWGGRANGPDDTMEVVECDDPVRATDLAIKNLERVIKLIPGATRNERGYGTAKRLYTKTLEQWTLQMYFVVSLVGGHTTQHKIGQQEGPVFTAIPPQDQREAVAFLVKEAFHDPLWMEAPEITRRYEMQGSLKRISDRQIAVLNDLLLPKRLKRLEEMELMNDAAYKQMDLFDDLHAGLWGELEEKRIVIDPYRQQLQRAYITKMKLYLESKKYGYSSYTQANILNALTTIRRSITSVRDTVEDAPTKGHLELCLLELCETFDK